MGEAHARLGPSNHCWPHCPGSVREEAAYPDVPGAAAIDGTGSHLLLEMCLKNGVRADAYDGQIIGVNHHDSPNGWLVGTERIERVQMCLDYIERRVMELRAQYPDNKAITVQAETTSDPGGMFGRDDWWGTLDITVTVFGRNDECLFMECIDYKDGRGWVNAIDNTQLLSYMAGKLRPFIASGPDLVRPFRPEQAGPCRMTIVQPKTSPVIRYQDTDARYVIEKAEWLADRARATDDPDAPLIPDDKGGKGHCQWCKHKPNCNAHTERSVETMQAMGKDIIATEGQSLFELVNSVAQNLAEIDAEQLADLADCRAGIEAAFDKIDAEIQARVEAGRVVPGYEMRPGKGSNVWNESEEEVAKKLKGKRLKKDEIWETKLRSPAQILKTRNLSPDQKKKIEDELITYTAGKLKLTKVAREKQTAQTPEMMFGDVQKDVAQSGTIPVNFDSKSLFEDSQPEQTSSEVSFF